jgi:hypothetical protein
LPETPALPRHGKEATMSLLLLILIIVVIVVLVKAL